MSSSYSYIFLIALQRAEIVAKPPFRVTIEMQRKFEKEFHSLIVSMNAAWRAALDKEEMRGSKLRTGSAIEELKRREARPVTAPVPPHGEGLLKYALPALLSLTDCTHSTVVGSYENCKLCLLTPSQCEAKQLFEPKTLKELLEAVMLLLIKSPEWGDYTKRAKPEDPRLIQLKRANDLYEARQHLLAENAAMAIRAVTLAEQFMDTFWSRTTDEIKSDASLEPISKEILLQFIWTHTESNTDVIEYHRIVDKLYTYVRPLIDKEFEKYSLYWKRVHETCGP